MHVVIIGSGIAGVTFAEKFRALAPDAQISLLTQETYGYYARPLLSHGFSRDNIEQTIVLKSFDALRGNGIEVTAGVHVAGIERGKREITVRAGQYTAVLAFDLLVLAPGSDAFVPPPLLANRELFFVLNSLEDLKVLRKFRRQLLEQQRKPHWAMIGGGLIGCEVASDLAAAGDQVSTYHMMDRLMERQLAAEDSQSLLEALQNAGIEVLLNQTVQGFEQRGERFAVRTAAGSSGEFDGIIAACGFKPRTALAAGCELATGRGIKVNQFLQTGDPAIYALGDAAELPNGKLYAFIRPIIDQAQWLARHFSDRDQQPWQPPAFAPRAKVHGFEAKHPYLF